MHILITSIIDLEKTTYSRLHHFIEHFLSKGYKVTVVSIRDTWKHQGIRQNQDLIKRIKVHYLTDRRIGVLWQKGKAVFTVGRILRRIHPEKVDVHLAYNSLIMGYLFSRRLKAYGIRTVYDLADDLPDMLRTSPQIPSVLRPVAARFGKIMLNKNLRGAALVTFSAQEFLDSMHISDYPHHYLPNGVDLKRFRPLRDKHKGVVIGYVGALREWVDLTPMLSAVKNLVDYRLKVLIVGGEEDLARYREFVKDQGMERMVTFTGNIPYSEVPKYINMMDITTVPFRKNRVTDGTCPLKLLEYLACEKPAIVSSLNETRRMLGNQVLYADTISEWGKQISTLYHDAILREKLGKEGRHFVEEHFNWKRICDDMELILVKNARPKVQRPA
jgi:glycosyltransferase involved in cell wall biosynthesis